MTNLEIIQQSRQRVVAEQAAARKRLAELDEAQATSYDEARDAEIRAVMHKIVSLADRAGALDRSEAIEREISGGKR